MLEISILEKYKALDLHESTEELANVLKSVGTYASMKKKQYGRDFLLQLRLHPLSIQKPKDMPDLEIAKDKLYIGHMTDSSSPESDEYKTPEYTKRKKEAYPFYSKMFPCRYSYQNMQPFPSASKYRHLSFNNEAKKHFIGAHPCCGDFQLDDMCLLGKKYYTSSEEMWNCFQNHSQFCSKKYESTEAVPKSRKKLSIIDPVTGKDILDNEDGISSNEQGNSTTINPLSASGDGTECDIELLEKDCTNYSEGNGETGFNEANVSGEVGSSETAAFEVSDSLDQTEHSVLDISKEKLKTGFGDTHFVGKDSKKQFSAVKNFNISAGIASDNPEKSTHPTKSLNCDFSKQSSKQGNAKNTQSHRDTSADIHANCHYQQKKDGKPCECSETSSKLNESLHEYLKAFSDKLQSLRQDQQRIAIMKSFLRFKKYQLEENAKILDDKRLELANWEYNLINRGKALQEKEQWLDSKNVMLCQKSQLLTEKENNLNKEQKFYNYFQAADDNSVKMVKEGQSVEKTAESKSSSSKWGEGYDSEKCAMEFIPSKNKSLAVAPQLNVAKCETESFCLDELEKNIVILEKMHSSEVGDANFDGKSDNSKSSAVIKDGSKPEPLPESKGRRYLPEHIKYWLNKKDKFN